MTSDIRRVDDVWCFDVNEFDDKGTQVKQLKTVNARRLVPLHPTLMELGLLEHVDKAKEVGRPRLWNKLGRDSRGKYQRNIKDWYNGADNRPGFENIYISTESSKSFHSLRHTFINELKQKMTDSRTITELAGHRHGTLSGDRYGKPLSVEVKLKAVETIDYYGIDFIGRLRHITI